MQDWTSYDAVATTYARVHAPRFEDPCHALVELVGITAGQQVLDVGTGTGVAAVAARDRGAQAVGADASLPMLAEGRRSQAALPLVAAEALDLPFRSGSFDAVLGSFVLAHFARVDTAMYELLRVTRPGGRHGFTSWADAPDTFTETWLELVFRAVPREMLEPTLARAIPNHERFRRPAGLETALYDAGLRKVRVERRVYEWTYARDDYVEGLSSWATGRFVRSMLGERDWEAFMTEAHAVFAARFPDPLHDRREVLFATGVKE
jgi:ubiquinone/menaquinone biosynthesis C-methylase UbiE